MSAYHFIGSFSMFILTDGLKLGLCLVAKCEMWPVFDTVQIL